MLVGEGQEKKANVPAQSTWKTSSTYPWTSNCGLPQRHVLFESDLQITRLSWSANRAAKDLAEAAPIDEKRRKAVQKQVTSNDKEKC
jgi:hypothetical protein